MAYSHQSNKSGTTYYLHSKETESRGGKRTLFFFSKEVKEAKDGTLPLDAVPEGYTVTESAQTGLPLLKKADKGEAAAAPAAAEKPTKADKPAKAPAAKADKPAKTEAAAKTDKSKAKK